MEIFTDGRNFKKAFKCNRCPKQNGEDGCPMWWEYVEYDIESGKERLTKQCGYVAMPKFLQSVISASNRPAAEIGAMRNEVVKAVANLSKEFVGKQLSHEN